jgi:hypothetical protein
MKMVGMLCEFATAQIVVTAELINPKKTEEARAPADQRKQGQGLEAI